MSIFRNLRTVDSLRVPIFRWYFISRLFDASAMNIRQMALIYLMYELTSSATLLGVLVLARAIPLMFLSPLAGAVADRVQKKYLIIGASLVDTLVTLGIVAGLMTGYISAAHPASSWVLIASAVLNGMVTGTKGPSNDAMIIEVVGPERITNAVALTQMGQNLLRIISPAVAGVMIDKLGFTSVYVTMAVLYVGAVAFMAIVPPLSRPHHARTNIFGDVRAVWNYLLQEKDLLYVLLGVFAMVFMSMPYRQLMPIFTNNILMVGATGFGILNAVQGVGSIAGSIWLASIPEAKNRGKWLLASGLLLGITIAVFAFSRSWYLSLGIMVLIGLGQAGRMTLPVALLQSYTKNEYRGRIMSFYGVNLGLSSFGSFFAAIMSNHFGIQWSVGGLALILAGFSIFAYLFVPRIRKIQ